MWAIGFGTSIAYTTNYAIFTWTAAIVGGIGSGLLFWNVWIMLPSWVPIHSRAFPLATMWLVISPQLYLFFMTYIIWGLDAIRIEHLHGWVPLSSAGPDIPPEPASLWGFTYVILVPMGSFALAVCACFLATSDAHEVDLPMRDKEDLNNMQSRYPDWAGHPHPVVFALFLLSCGLFQGVYYLPYVFMPTFATLSPIDGGTRESTVSLGLLAGGVIVGKILASILFSIVGSENLKTSFHVLVFFSTGLMITACTWISCVTIESTYAVAFFIGFFAGGIIMSNHIAIYMTEPMLVLNYSTSALISIYAFATALGQTLVTLLVHYVAGGGGYVYSTAAFACAMFLACSTLPWLIPAEVSKAQPSRQYYQRRVIAARQGKAMYIQ